MSAQNSIGNHKDTNQSVPHKLDLALVETEVRTELQKMIQGRRKRLFGN